MKREYRIYWEGKRGATGKAVGIDSCGGSDDFGFDRRGRD